jgi:hypothetical protein
MIQEDEDLSQLFLSSIEFCFDTQANSLNEAYDLKIAQCFIAMHKFM